MAQYLVVALIVVLAALYVGRKYLPAAWRRRTVHFFTRRGAEQSRLVRWLDTDDSCGSGCGSCNTCEPGEPEQAEPTAGKHRVIKLHVKR
jgi:hypothetical protein